MSLLMMPLLTVPLRPGDQEANNQPHSPLFIVRESSINGGWVVICPGDLLLIAREIFYRVPDRILEKNSVVLIGLQRVGVLCMCVC